MEIMATFDESLVPMEERSAEFAPVLSAVIDPLTQACSISAAPLKAPDMAVYLMNCLSVVQVLRIFIHSLSPGFYDFRFTKGQSNGIL